MVKYLLSSLRDEGGTPSFLFQFFNFYVSALVPVFSLHTAFHKAVKKTSCYLFDMWYLFCETFVGQWLHFEIQSESMFFSLNRSVHILPITYFVLLTLQCFKLNITINHYFPTCPLSKVKVIISYSTCYRVKYYLEYSLNLCEDLYLLASLLLSSVTFGNNVYYYVFLTS